jgi:hypothetical protein
MLITIVTLLADKQKEAQLNDRQFAKVLGVVRPLWAMTKSGTKPVGLTLLRAIARAYPEFDSQILAFLRNGNG